MVAVIRRVPWGPRLWALVAVMLVAGLALAWYPYANRGSAPPTGQPTVEQAALSTGLTRFPPGQRPAAPELRGPTLDGGELALAELRGNVVVLNVWGSWCAPCRAEAPDLARAARETAPLGVRFVGVDTRDNPAAARAFVREFAIPYPSLVDSDGRLLLGFHGIVPVSAVPSTVFVDRDGRIAAAVIGRVTYPTLRGLLEELTAQPVSNDSAEAAR